jgi:hypothetical protein
VGCVVPSAMTMLDAYRAQLAAARGSGLAGVAVQAKLGPVVLALVRLINEDTFKAAERPAA